MNRKYNSLKIKKYKALISLCIAVLTVLCISAGLCPSGSCTKTARAADNNSSLYYTLTLNCGGGIVSGSGIVSGNAIANIVPNSKRDVPDPERKGYWFRGWFKESKFQNQFVPPAYVDKSMTLYAKWEKKESSSKDTITVRNITDGTYTAHVSADLTGQSYDYSVTCSAAVVEPMYIKDVANSMKEPAEKFLGINIGIPGLFYDSQNPVPVTVTLPPEFDLQETGVYLTTNRKSVMAEMPYTVVSGISINNKFVTTGNSICFNVYQDGIYILLDTETPEEIIESKVPRIQVNYKNYQLAVGKEMKLKIQFIDFTKEETQGYKVEWKSKNPKRASVDSKGWVKGLKKGKATIRCKVTTKDGETYIKNTKLEILP